jgi:hypothetical protein
MYLTGPRRRTVATLGPLLTGAALAIGVLSAGVAHADDGLRSVKCDQTHPPSCTLTARAPGITGSTAQPAAQPRPRPAAAPASPQPCHDVTGAPLPCTDPRWGTLGSDGCYYKPSTPSAAVQSSLGGAGTGPGGWYDFTCPLLSIGTLSGTRWIAGGPPLAGAAAVPGTLAQQAESRLALPASTIRMSPTTTQVIRVPTWLWLDSGAWAARSASAAVPGVSVTATATPTRVVWSTGDGATVTCTGPGTPWQVGDNPAAASPTCGHTYTTGSTSAPGGVFTVTATVTWSIAWVGGGQNGALPALTTTATASIRVAPVQTVIVPG